jgi:hypothetical protein
MAPLCDHRQAKYVGVRREQGAANVPPQLFCRSQTNCALENELKLSCERLLEKTALVSSDKVAAP